MSTSENASAEATEPVAPKAKGGALRLIVAMAVAAAASAGGMYFMTHQPAASSEHEPVTAGHGDDGHGGTGKPKAAQGEAQYQALAPAFVVNLADGNVPRYLMTDIEVMARQGDVEAVVTEHLPSLRNAVLLLLSQQSSTDVATREGKLALQQAVLETVQEVLRKETGAPVIEAVFFTSFVVQ